MKVNKPFIKIAPVALYVIVFALAACNNRSRSPLDGVMVGTPYSPSGKYELKVIPGKAQDYVRFQIIDRSLGTVVCESDLDFCIRMRTYIMWGDTTRKDVVWVYSGDIGTYYWRMDTPPSWKSYSLVPNGKNNEPYPNYFKQQKCN